MKTKKSNLPAVIKKEIKPRGGARPGSGRPLEQKLLFQELNLKIISNRKQLIKLLKKL